MLNPIVLRINGQIDVHIYKEIYGGCAPGKSMESRSKMYTSIYIYIHTYVNILNKRICMYIYIYI